MTTALASLREKIDRKLQDPFSRPFVCRGSPLDQRTFIVGLNAATALPQPFWSYWSDEQGFLWEKFSAHYDLARKRAGNRPRIERLSKGLGGALETNLWAKPTASARKLKLDDRRESLLPLLFDEIQPRIIFAHSMEPIRFLEQAVGRPITDSPVWVDWRGRRVLMFGRMGPLYRMGLEDAEALGRRLRILAEV